MLNIIFYLVLFIFLLSLGYWYYVYWFVFLKHLHKLPYKPLWPIIGNTLQLLPLSDMTKTLMEYRKLGKTQKLNLLYDILVFTSDQKFIEYLTTSKQFIMKSKEYDFFIPWLNDGLLTSKGKKWFQRRKMLTPSFHFGILQEFIEVFDRCGNILIEKLRNNTDKGVIDIYPYITLFALDVIYESTMGVKIDAQTKENSEYVQMVKLESNIIMERIIVAWKRVNCLFKLSPDSVSERRAVKLLHKATEAVIISRRELRMNNKDECITKKKCFLDILLESTIDGMPLSNGDIREEVDTFLFEGHDTTSSAIGFALYELSINPDIQVKVFEELKYIYGNDKKFEIASSDFQEMKYLDMVIKETLRKYPSVPIMGRTCESDMEYDGMVIPKGATLTILPYVLHREEDTFPNPERFDPERFSADNKTKIKPYAYIPFSAGFRNCIGQKFAMMELKSILSKIIMNFELLPADNYKPKLLCEVILRSGNGIKLKLRCRK